MNIKLDNHIYLNLFVTLIFLIISLNYLYNAYPAEDALILYRYSNNFYNFFEIVFNKGDRPVEGATDFLWMISIAILKFLKLDPAVSAILINSISFFLIINIISRKLFKNINLIYQLIFTFLFLNIGSIINPSIMGFSTITFFALGSLVFLYAIEKKIYLWTIFSILFCLFRPEAVIFFIFSIPIIYINLNNIEIKKFYTCLIILISIGILYNIFRFTYFDDILPITLQIKSIGGDFSIRRIFGVASQISSTFFIIIFVYVISSLTILYKKNSVNKYEIIIFISINLSLIIYIFLLSKSYLSQNIYYRYFAHFHFIYFIFTIYLFNKNFKNKFFNLFFIILIIIGSFDQSNYLQKILKITNQNISTPTYKIFNKINNVDSHPLVGISHSLKKNKDYLNIMITEAGHLPYISNKYSIDMAGLNTYTFSKRPVICDDFIKMKPNLIEFDVGLLEYFSFEEIIKDETFPDCGFTNKSEFYNKKNIFNYENLKIIDNYHYFKSQKHKNATVYVAANNALFCLKNNDNFNDVFINKRSDQVYIIENNVNLKKSLLDSCSYKSNGYINDLILKDR